MSWLDNLRNFLGPKSTYTHTNPNPESGYVDRHWGPKEDLNADNPKEEKFSLSNFVKQIFQSTKNEISENSNQKKKVTYEKEDEFQATPKGSTARREIVSLLMPNGYISPGTIMNKHEFQAVENRLTDDIDSLALLKVNIDLRKKEIDAVGGGRFITHFFAKMFNKSITGQAEQLFDNVYEKSTNKAEIDRLVQCYTSKVLFEKGEGQDKWEGLWHVSYHGLTKDDQPNGLGTMNFMRGADICMDILKGVFKGDKVVGSCERLDPKGREFDSIETGTFEKKIGDAGSFEYILVDGERRMSQSGEVIKVKPADK